MKYAQSTVGIISTYQYQYCFSYGVWSFTKHKLHKILENGSGVQWQKMEIFQKDILRMDALKLEKQNKILTGLWILLCLISSSKSSLRVIMSLFSDKFFWPDFFIWTAEFQFSFGSERYSSWNLRRETESCIKVILKKSNI